MESEAGPHHIRLGVGRSSAEEGVLQFLALAHQQEGPGCCCLAHFRRRHRIHLHLSPPPRMIHYRHDAVDTMQSVQSSTEDGGFDIPPEASVDGYLDMMYSVPSIHRRGWCPNGKSRRPTLLSAVLGIPCALHSFRLHMMINCNSQINERGW